MNRKHIYLLKTDLRNNADEYVYKIGSCNLRNFFRINNYQIIYLRACIDTKLIESKLLEIFNQKYKKQLVNGYYSGNEKHMVYDIDDCISSEYDF